MATWARSDLMNEELVEPEGSFFNEDGVDWYRIDDYDRLDPFLVNVVTPDDLWIYVSTSGALTAGRRSAEHAVFPYETDDRLHRSGGLSGPLTLIRPTGREEVWQPFAPDAPFGRVHRSVAKSAHGDRLRFSEHHPELGMTFSYIWAGAGRFGLVRICELAVDDDAAGPLEVELLDGLVNILPAGVELAAQQSTSTLVDAYRRSEFDEASGLALYTLEALISDRADPAESLTANVVWSRGLANPTVVLSERSVRAFRSGLAIEPEHLVTGRKGAFLQAASAMIRPGGPLRWMTVIDADQDHVAVSRVRQRLNQAAGPGAAEQLMAEVQAEADGAHDGLGDIAAAADGVQVSADRRATVHHFANVLFNCMRGGVFLDDHRVEVGDVQRFVTARNRGLAPLMDRLTGGLDPVVDIDVLRQAVASEPDLQRLVNEYLPLTFSRRHGDPSRPWNAFSIPARGADGRTAKGYEGNWRDIFQNWEALLYSFPLYIESVIAKFLNASTLDGHNPYRITDRGIDWEVPEHGSWGNFGYWGDHQIVYLHRLLLTAQRFHPGLLESRLDVSAHSYADVPYRIRRHEDLVRDPKHTLDFDEGRQLEVEGRVEVLGADGRLVPGDGLGGVHLASLAEKLLVPALAKLSNLVAGGGIWLNTQRPEWNDANNALVGNGVSVVTLFHLRDYLAFVDELLERSTASDFPMSESVTAWMQGLHAAFDRHRGLVAEGTVTPEGRRDLLDALGAAYSDYRADVYDHGPGPAAPVPVSDVRDFLSAVAPHLALAAEQARRPDGLVHTYWLLRLEPGRAHLEPLYEMLEGQVAALAGSDTAPATVLSMVDALFAGELYRPDQQSFILYPNRLPPSFLDKNVVPDPGSAAWSESDSEREPGGLLAALGGITRRDHDGVLRFAPHLHSARLLEAELDALEADPDLGSLVSEARSEVLAAYESVFHHRAFTGRSQTMYRYEGLGSIYWHMVSKLLFALQERTSAAVAAGESNAVLAELIDRYRRVREGLGYRKSAAVQGSFPTDPHSHTPAHTGAQQPGMTGQVKEGVLIRWGELGLHVDQGRLRFDPVVLDAEEFLTEPVRWPALGGDGTLEPGSLGFTYCGVPIVYRLVEGDSVAGGSVTWADGRRSTFDGELDRATSQALFARSGAIERIDVDIHPRALRFSSSPPEPDRG